MKILDKYLLKTFIITFTTVFVILFFIFVLQTVWLFISELAGKDLDTLLILKFLLFSMPRIIPLVLPLSVLLASIMTFGSLSENYEFAAMKSSGISLQRAMRSLTVFILLLSIVSFLFANNVIPYAEYKFINFRRNIAQVKPAMAIAEGQFSKIGNYTIKVEKKSGENGDLLSGVTIHKKLDNGEGSTTVIKAEKGELVSSENSNVLKLVLTDGYYYEDIIPKKYEERNKIPFAKATFKRDVINIDLSKLNQSTENNTEISNTESMLNISELRYTLDSLKLNYKKDIISNSENIYQRVGLQNQYNSYSSETKNKTFNPKDILSSFNTTQKREIYKIAQTNIENVGFSIDSSIIEMEAKLKNINRHWIALYDKFVIAFSCILMFFIGAPLGAIIRKGGLGLPIVFAVAIFIVFHFINTFGKRVAQENGMSPFLGTWMATLILTPLAVSLTYRAINDIGEINFDFFTNLFKKIIPIDFDKKKNLQPIINLDSYTIVNQEEQIKLNQHSDETLIGIVKNAKQFGYTNDYRNSALKILASRGISQDNLLLNNNLYNVDYENMLDYSELYYKYSKIAFASNIIGIIIANAIKNNVSVLLLIAGFLNIFVFYYSLTNAQKKLDKIGEIVGRKIEPGIVISTIVGFPFYLFIYFYQNKTLKESLAQYR